MSEAHELRLASGQEPVDWERGSIFFNGNATVLNHCAGMTLLTDPTFIDKHEETWIRYEVASPRERVQDRSVTPG